MRDLSPGNMVLILFQNWPMSFYNCSYQGTDFIQFCIGEGIKKRFYIILHANLNLDKWLSRYSLLSVSLFIKPTQINN